MERYFRFVHQVYFWSDVCGFNATATEVPQPITSPGWPDSYANSLDCVWFITAPTPADRILLELSTFQTEICCDSLEVIVCYYICKYVLTHLYSFFEHIKSFIDAFLFRCCMQNLATIVFHIRMFYLFQQILRW